MPTIPSSVTARTIDLGLKYGSLRTEALAGAKSLVEIKLPSSDGVSIPGWVAWSKKIQEPGGASIIAGIKFEPLSDDARDFLKVYCFEYESEERRSPQLPCCGPFPVASYSFMTRRLAAAATSPRKRLRFDNIEKNGGCNPTIS